MLKGLYLSEIEPEIFKIQPVCIHQSAEKTFHEEDEQGILHLYDVTSNQHEWVIKNPDEIFDIITSTTGYTLRKHKQSSIIIDFTEDCESPKLAVRWAKRVLNRWLRG